MKLMLVDLDGTLVDTRLVNFYAYKAALREFGYDLEYSVFEKECFGKRYTDFLPSMLGGDSGKVSVVHTIKKKKYRDYLDCARINTALVDILRLCRTEYKNILVTTASRENTEMILAFFRLEDLFDYIVTGEDVQKAKPDPQGYLIAMRRFSADPKECVIFEDSPIGIEAAKKTGSTVFCLETTD